MKEQELGWLEALVAEHQAKTTQVLTSEWKLGFRDRGHGHGDFAILDSTGELICECAREYAAHIIELHNRSLPVSEHDR